MQTVIVPLQMQGNIKNEWPSNMNTLKFVREIHRAQRRTNLSCLIHQGNEILLLKFNVMRDPEPGHPFQNLLSF